MDINIHDGVEDLYTGKIVSYHNNPFFYQIRITMKEGVNEIINPFGAHCVMLNNGLSDDFIYPTSSTSTLYNVGDEVIYYLNVSKYGEGYNNRLSGTLASTFLSSIEILHDPLPYFIVTNTNIKIESEDFTAPNGIITTPSSPKFTGSTFKTGPKIWSDDALDGIYSFPPAQYSVPISDSNIYRPFAGCPNMTKIEKQGKIGENIKTLGSIDLTYEDDKGYVRLDAYPECIGSPLVVLRYVPPMPEKIVKVSSIPNTLINTEKTIKMFMPFHFREYLIDDTISSLQLPLAGLDFKDKEMESCTLDNMNFSLESSLISDEDKDFTLTLPMLGIVAPKSVKVCENIHTLHMSIIDRGYWEPTDENLETQTAWLEWAQENKNHLLTPQYISDNISYGWGENLKEYYNENELWGYIDENCLPLLPTGVKRLTGYMAKNYILNGFVDYEDEGNGNYNINYYPMVGYDRELGEFIRFSDEQRWLHKDGEPFLFVMKPITLSDDNADNNNQISGAYRNLYANLFIDEIVRKVEKIWEPFKGLEPLIAGIALALSSGFLSQLPIIGSLFSGITMPVGLLLGMVVVLNNKFESFGNLMETIGSSIGDFFTGVGNTISGTSSLLSEDSPLSKFFTQLQNYINNIDFVSLGEKLGEGLNKIFGFLEGTATGIQDQIRPLYESIRDFLTDFFEMFSDVGGSIDGENLGETIINILSALIDGVGALLPALNTVFSTIGAIFTSDVFTAIFNTLVDIASFIVSNEAVLVTFVSILGALFVGSKLATLIQNFSSFQTITTTMGDIFKGIFDNLMKTIKELPKLTKGIMGALTEFIKGLSKSLGELGKAAPSMAKNMMIAAREFIKLAFDVIKLILKNIGGMAGAIISALPTILLISLLIIGVTGLLLLLKEMGLFEMLGEMIDFMIEKMGDLLVIIADVLGLVLENIGNFLDQLAESLTTMIPVISGAIVDLVDAFGRNFVAIIDSLHDFLIVLAIFGPMSLIGATAFALGLGEIALALGALAGGSALGGIADFVSGKEGSSLEVLTELVKSLATFSTEINKLPDTLLLVMPAAFSAGFKIGEEIQKGLFGGFNFSYVESEFDNLISRLQTNADLNPIQIQVDDSNLRGYSSNVSSSGTGPGRSSTFNDNSSRTVNVTTKSQDFVNQFIKSSRGYI